MELDQLLEQLCIGPERAGDLDAEQAHALFAAMLDGALPEFEIGSVLTALRWKRETMEELAGFVHASNERMRQIVLPPGLPRCAVIPSYDRRQRQPNLMPLLAVLLSRFGVPVIVHGNHATAAPIPSFEVLQRLGHAPVASFAAIEQQLILHSLAVVPTALLLPQLNTLLTLRERLGMRNNAYLVAKFLDPCPDVSLRLACISKPELIEQLRTFLRQEPGGVLLMRGAEGEAYADPARRPRIELFDHGRSQILFEAECSTDVAIPHPDAKLDATHGAALIGAMLEGHRPIPQPLLNQLAACLYAAGHTADLACAKAHVAVGLPLTAPA